MHVLDVITNVEVGQVLRLFLRVSHPCVVIREGSEMQQASWW